MFWQLLMSRGASSTTSCTGISLPGRTAGILNIWSEPGPSYQLTGSRLQVSTTFWSALPHGTFYPMCACLPFVRCILAAAALLQCLSLREATKLASTQLAWLKRNFACRVAHLG